jgi:hypothetical protein
VSTPAPQLHALHPREASIFAAIADAFVAPAPPLPPVRDTDTAFALDANLRAAPAANRAGLRAALLALELAPLALGYGRRLRRLDPVQRAAALERVERGPLAGLVKGLRTLAHLSYYGDPHVLRLLGYDADAVVARAAALRAAEGRW